eukprot:SAG31_NODE_1637_length_7679_cov_5.133509_7_plen_98_part_00
MEKLNGSLLFLMFVDLRLSDYAPTVATYGENMNAIIRRIKVDNVHDFGFTKAEAARFKKGLKSERKKRAEMKKAAAAKEDEAAEAAAQESSDTESAE